MLPTQQRIDIPSNFYKDSPFYIVESFPYGYMIKMTLIMLFFLQSRRYSQDSNPTYYSAEKFLGNAGATPDLPGWDNNTSGDGEHAIPVHLFPKHVAELHMDQVRLIFPADLTNNKC